MRTMFYQSNLKDCWKNYKKDVNINTGGITVLMKQTGLNSDLMYKAAIHLRLLNFILYYINIYYIAAMSFDKFTIIIIIIIL